MFITLGIKLVHTKELMPMFKIVKEKLLIFLETIFFTLYNDLLLEIFIDMFLKMIIHVLIVFLFHHFLKIIENYQLKMKNIW